MRKSVRWQIVVALSAIVMLLGTVPLALPLTYLSERGVSLESVGWVEGYFATLTEHGGYWLAVHREWLAQALSSGRFPPLVVVFPFLALTVLGVGLRLNPHSMIPAVYGSARWADDGDVARMGLLSGMIVVLGQWRRRWLTLPETLSVLCIAPPGTGKTAAVVVPTILKCDGTSMIINDVKPELHAITSGYRQRVGPVFRLEWAAEDDPAAGIYHPRWNPLSPRSLPDNGPQRDLYIERLGAVLIPDPQGGADPHWSKKGRAALVGLTHFIVSKCEHGDMRGLPAEWQGREACFPMLLDWITEASLAAGEKIEALKESDPNAAFMADPIRMFLIEAVNEAREKGYAHRAVMELTQLANTPDRERGSILSTMDAGLTIFKNSAVRQRTAVSDFQFSDVRGMRDPRGGKLRPLTIYLCVSQEDGRALGVISALFIEALSAYLTSHPPGHVDAAGRKSGPYPALFVLDEFPQMPKIQALIDGPAVGRGQKVSYLLIGQDFAQIEDKYGKTGLETLLSTTAAKVVLPLNNEAVAKRFSEMVGSRTFEGKTSGRTYGFSRQANPFAVNINKSLSAVALIHPADFMAMPAGTHIVLFQKFTNRPIRARTPFYFKDRVLRRRAWDVRKDRGPRPAPALPEWLAATREVEVFGEEQGTSEGRRAGSPSMGTP
ncbi:type IV secretory system conjugative DNA transfer family protein [Telmatospirillum siberiense]|nr:type IV secretory system conjugative DNA transfer family protein [Telmatospirillum siberiense]